MRNDLGYSPKWTTVEAFDDYVRGRGLTRSLTRDGYAQWRAARYRRRSVGDVNHTSSNRVGEGIDVAGESKAKVIPLHCKYG